MNAPLQSWLNAVRLSQRESRAGRTVALVGFPLQPRAGTQPQLTASGERVQLHKKDGDSEGLKLVARAQAWHLRQMPSALHSTLPRNALAARSGNDVYS